MVRTSSVRRNPRFSKTDHRSSTSRLQFLRAQKDYISEERKYKKAVKLHNRATITSLKNIEEKLNKAVILI